MNLKENQGDLPMPEQPKINVGVKVVFESAGITDWSHQDPSGIFTVHVRAIVNFSGPLQAVVDRISLLDPEKVEAVTASAVSSSLVELLGPEIAEGGVYVHD